MDYCCWKTVVYTVNVAYTGNYGKPKFEGTHLTGLTVPDTQKRFKENKTDDTGWRYFWESKLKTNLRELKNF